jgi:hypothetical protein
VTSLFSRGPKLFLEARLPLDRNGDQLEFVVALVAVSPNGAVDEEGENFFLL